MFPKTQVAFRVRVEMATDQAAAEYRLHAAHCMGIARQSSDPERALAFLGMAKVWLTLADIVEKHSALSDVAPLEN